MKEFVVKDGKVCRLFGKDFKIRVREMANPVTLMV
jgi:hypothetical protein